MFKPLDGVLVAVIAAIALVWSQLGTQNNTTPESVIVVTPLGTDTLSLFTDTVIVLEHLTIEISDGRAAITRSDCPSQQCVQTGYINQTGQMSACVPNGVWIEIIGAEKITDSISY
ncbi:MAG: NusG domain II-containing protein [Candidatus Fermentibacteraceae bacterium]|nr:NusG domain II-containing protein [Candidatus Fermentibacteraceae bacterium]